MLLFAGRRKGNSTCQKEIERPLLYSLSRRKPGMFSTTGRASQKWQWTSCVRIGSALLLLFVLDSAMIVRVAFSQTSGLPPFAVARLGTLHLRPTGSIGDLAFSPDGKTLASLGMAKAFGWPRVGLLQLWNVSDGRLQKGLGTREWAFPISPREMAFAPDGKTIALAYSSAVASWNLLSGEIHQHRSDNARDIHGLAFSPDGKLLAWGSVASGQSDPTIMLYDPAANKPVREITLRTPPRLLRFSPTRNTIATIDRDGRIDLWDASNGDRLRSIQGHGVRHMAFSPSGTRLAGCGESGPICVWNTATGRNTLAIEAPKGTISDMAFTPSGKSLTALFVYEPYDDRGRFNISTWTEPNFLTWDATTGKLVAKQKTTYADREFAFSPDGEMLATAGSSRAITLRRFPENKDVLDLLGHTSGIQHVAYLPCGRLVASCGFDGKVFVWNSATGGLLWKPPITGCATAMAVSTRDNVLAIGICGRGVDIWNVSTKQHAKHLDIDGRRLATALKFSPDGDCLAGGDDTGRVVVWDLRTEQIVRKWEAATTGDVTDKTVHSLAWSPGGKLLVAADGYQVRWLDPKTGKTVKKSSASGQYAPRCIAFSPNGKILAESARGSCMLRSTTDHRETVQADAEMDGELVFSPDGTVLAGRDTAGAISLIDVSTGKVRAVVHDGSRDAIVEGLAFSPDGRFLASSAGDTTILIRNVEQIHEDGKAKEKSAGSR